MISTSGVSIIVDKRGNPTPIALSTGTMSNLPNPLSLVGKTPMAGIPNIPDPRLMYKSGERPTPVHSIDAAGWLAQGWSYEPQGNPEEQLPPIEHEREIQEEPKKRSPRKPSDSIAENPGEE